jgi:integrase
MIGNLKRRPDGYWIYDHVGPDGKRRRPSTGTKDKAEAQVIARRWALGIDEAASPNKSAVRPRPGRPDYSVAWLLDRTRQAHWRTDQIKSRHTIRSTIKFLEEHLGDLAADAVDDQVLLDFSVKLRGLGYAEATIKRRLDVLGKALRYGTKLKRADGSPVVHMLPDKPKLAVRNLKDRVLSPEEEGLVLEEMDRRARGATSAAVSWALFKSLWVLLLYTGVRLSEALAIAEAHIQERTLEGGAGVYDLYIPPYSTKNDKGRTIPLVTQAVAALDTMRRLPAEVRGEGPLFGMFNPGRAWYFLKELRKTLPWLEDVTLHTLRHTCLTRLYNNGRGLPLEGVKDWAGHSSIKITEERYVHRNVASLDSGRELLSFA